MKRAINIIFVVSMFLSVALAIQDLTREEDDRESGSSKPTGVSGTISADGERLVDDEAGKVYTINNPARLRPFAGHRVALVARVSADRAVNVESAKMIVDSAVSIG